MVYTEILNKNKDFLNLYKKGRSVVSKAVVIYVKPNGLSYNRFGITAGKKVGNAVMRNRAKRIIRQAYYENEILFPHFQNGWRSLQVYIRHILLPHS